MNDAQRDLIAKTIANTVTGIWVGAPIAALTGKMTWGQVAAAVVIAATFLNIAQQLLSQEDDRE
jgi:hypothetical protein